MKDVLLRAISVIGLIAILVFGAWGIIRLAVALPSFFSEVGSYWSASPDVPQEPVITSTTTVAEKPAITKTVAPAVPMPTYFGYPDLAVQMLSAQQFGGRVTVTFDIANRGSNIVGRGWYFNAVLPWAAYGQSQYTFSSAAQQQLNPGDHVTYTLTFDAPADYSNRRYIRNDRVVTIAADPLGAIYESNELNNAGSLGF